MTVVVDAWPIFEAEYMSSYSAPFPPGTLVVHKRPAGGLAVWH